MPGVAQAYKHFLTIDCLLGSGLPGASPCGVIRDLKQTTAAMAARPWKNKASNWQNNSSARAITT